MWKSLVLFSILLLGMLVGCQPVYPGNEGKGLSPTGSFTPGQAHPTETAQATRIPVTQTLSPTGTPTTNPVELEYLLHVLDVLKENSFYSKRVDWQEMYETVYASAAEAESRDETYTIINKLLDKLGDHHGYLMEPKDVLHYESATLDNNPSPEVKFLEDNIGYVLLPGFASGDIDVVNEYATRLQQSIAEIDAFEPCGWVVDLRTNGGGNMWAMLAGIGPIIGEGIAGSFVHADGTVEVWSYYNGMAMLDGVALVTVSGQPYQLKHPQPPVAVLTAQPTTSSGEAIAVAFRGRPATKSFGDLTFGLSSAIEGFMLEDGAMLGITVSMFADRNGFVYNGPIIPEQRLYKRQDPMFGVNEVPKAALNWLLEQPLCKPSKP